MSSKYLLLQYREMKAVADEERDTFARQAEIEPAQILTRNYLMDELAPLTEDDLIGVAGVFIGGASTVSVLQDKDLPSLRLGFKDIELLLDQGTPTFASCFGFQLAAVVLGGDLIRNADEQENCSLPLYLTAEGKRDELVGALHSEDSEDDCGGCVITVHREGLRDLPSGCVQLVRPTYWEQVFRVEGKPFWAFQGHPEVDQQALHERLWIYRKKYDLGSKEAYDAVLSQYADEHEANALLPAFCKLFS